MSLIVRHRRDAGLGAFRDVGRVRRQAIDLARADAVGEAVGQHGEVGRVLSAAAVGFGLDRLQGRDAPGGQGNSVDAETRRDGFEMIAEQLEKVRRIAARPRGADANRLGMIIGTAEHQVELARAFLFLFQKPAKPVDQMRARTRDVLRRADGFGEGDLPPARLGRQQ